MKELRMQEVSHITPRQGFARRETSDIRIVLIEKSLGQVKALSRKHLMMEETDYPVMSEHRYCTKKYYKANQLIMNFL